MTSSGAALAVAAELAGIDPRICVNCGCDESWVVMAAPSRMRKSHSLFGRECWGSSLSSSYLCVCTRYVPYGGVDAG